MNVLLSFDKFKDSLTAHEACNIAEQVFTELCPDWKIEKAPLSDGGEGFFEILTNCYDGEIVSEFVSNPIFKKIDANIGVVTTKSLPDSICESLNLSQYNLIGIVEMAQASGLQHLNDSERDLWKTSTFGTGELIQLAANVGVDVIIVGVGGSATSDLGMGALEALGVKFFDKEGGTIEKITPEKWPDVVKVDMETDLKLPPIFIATDVNNPLFGENGAAAIYGEQKGLKKNDFSRFEFYAKEMANLLCDFFKVDYKIIDKAGCGAAGGVGFGLNLISNAHFISGFKLIKNWLQLSDKIKNSELILTGEGSFDQSSFNGKGPAELLLTASKYQKKIYIFAGNISKNLNDYLPENINSNQLIQITPQDYLLQDALRDGKMLLSEAVRKCIQLELDIKNSQNIFVDPNLDFDV